MRLKICLGFLVAMALAATAAAQTKISGTIVCGKPDQQQAFEVGDLPGHMLAVSQGKCTWSKPMEIGGTQTKEEQGTLTADNHANKGNSRGYVVVTMASGDKTFVRVQG